MKLYIDDDCKKYLPIKWVSSTISSLPDERGVYSIEFSYPINFVLYSKSSDNVYKMVDIANNIKEIYVPSALPQFMKDTDNTVELISIGNHYGISCTYKFWKYYIIPQPNRNNALVVYDY